MNRRRAQGLGFGLLALALALAAILLHAAFAPLTIAPVSLGFLIYAIGQGFGLLGLLCLSLLVISGDTARFFDRFFGIDAIIKAQRKFSLVASSLVALHPLFFILSDASYARYLVPGAAALPYAFGAIALYILVGVMVASRLYKRISHEAWQYIHIATYLLLFFAFYHALLAGSTITRNVKTVFIILITGLAIAIAYRTNYKIKQMRTNRFRVAGIRWETERIFTLTLDRGIAFKAGQFCFLRLEGRRLFARHPFTMSSKPGEPLAFTMKLEGRFTRAASNLRPGDEVIVDGPYGRFILDEKPGRLVFIAGGVGITPFMSMARYLAGHGGADATLFYCVSTRKELVFREELDRMAWLRKIYVISRENLSAEEKEWESGRLNEETLRRHAGRMPFRAYICGPEGLKDTAVAALLRMGAKRSEIFYEDFFW